VALDISAATGKDLESVSIALAKASNGQVTALQRLGIPLDENAVKTKDFNAILGQLTDTFGGAAETAANSYEGQMKRMGIAIDNAKENIGMALLPILEKLIPVLDRAALFVQNNTNVLVALGAVIGSVAAAVLLINGAMKVYQATLVIVKVAQMALNFAMSANPIGLIIIGIAALVAAFVVLEMKFGVVSKAVKFLGDAFRAYIINPLATILDLVGKVISALGKIPGVGKIAGAVGGLVGKIPGLAEGGIVTSPTLAMIGEGGEPEAVIPLSKMNQMGNVTININSAVADASLGDIIVNALKQYNRRSGPVQVQIA
jgi:hypothetical protein